MPTHQRKEVPSDVQNTEALSAVQSNEVHQDGNSGGVLSNLLEKKFKLRENGTSVRTEVIAGTATFLAAAAMPAITPAVLGAAGWDKMAVFTATVLILMGSALAYAFWVKYPFVCGPSIGVSPWVAFYVVNTLGVPWQAALMCSFIAGVLFILLSVVGFREKILGAIPMTLKHAFGAGIGAFITTVGLLQTGIIKTDSKSFFGLSLGDLTATPTLMAIITIFIIGFFIVRNIQGGFLVGVLAFAIAGIFIMDPATGSPITKWTGEIFSFANPIAALSPTLFKLSFAGMENLGENIWMTIGIIIFITFFIDVFDTVGTVSGIATLGGFIDENGNIPRINRVFMVDALGTTIGGLLGLTLVTTYIESSVGVAEGGKTGLTSLWIAVLFGLTLFFAPIFTMVPAVASGSAITLIGALMIKSVLKIDLNDFTEALPAFFCIFMMPFTGNMGTGILIGIFTYTILKTLAGKQKEVNPTLWILSIIFIFYVIANQMI
ncbi:MAG: NCS2 family permease [Deltaproteobacteria bacterium]|nr:NCS2 family permease [Deltaproteobacteria bacterium]